MSAGVPRRTSASWGVPGSPEKELRSGHGELRRAMAVPQRQYLHVPRPVEAGAPERLWRKVAGLALLPAYLAAARALGAPGIGVHLRLAGLALRLWREKRIPSRTAYTMSCAPLDSTRYFEFEEVLRAAGGAAFGTLLDVSSPRLIPLLLVKDRPGVRAHLANPDPKDLAETARMAEALGVAARVTLTADTVGDLRLEPGSFDLVTCVSVLEHIPDDRQAVATLWSLVKPGGRLILTVPCMARPVEQFISENEYGVLAPDADGYTFWQRFYDPERLQEVLTSQTAVPLETRVFGEREHGLFYRNATLKRVLGARYPFWQESYLVAREYRRFGSVEELPGEGVVLLVVRKPLPGESPLPQVVQPEPRHVPRLVRLLSPLIPKPVRRLAFEGLLRGLDAFETLTGRRGPMVPPRHRQRVGTNSFTRSDFMSIGEGMLRQLVEHGGIRPTDRVLEAGCGIGRMAIQLTSYLDVGTEYHGFDIVADGIEWCRTRITPRHPNFHFQHSNVYNYLYNPGGTVPASEYRFPFDDASFDFVFLTSVFTHMLRADMENYLREVGRVLRPGGRCFITWFLRNAEADALTEAGRSTMLFHWPLEGCWTIHPEQPEDAIAFAEDHVRELYDRNGLRIVEPILHGSWSGRSDTVGYQDIVVAEKAT